MIAFGGTGLSSTGTIVGLGGFESSPSSIDYLHTGHGSALCVYSVHYFSSIHLKSSRVKTLQLHYKNVQNIQKAKFKKN